MIPNNCCSWLRNEQQERRAGSSDHLRQELDVEKRMPEVAGLSVVAEKPFGVDHVRCNAGNQNEADPRRQSVRPADENVVAFGELVPVIIERECRRTLTL